MMRVNVVMMMMVLGVARIAGKMATASSSGLSFGKGLVGLEDKFMLGKGLVELDDEFLLLEDDYFEGSRVHISNNDVDDAEIVSTAEVVTVKDLVVLVKFLLDLGIFFVVVAGAHRFYRERFSATSDDAAADEQLSVADFGALLDAVRAGQEDVWRKLLQAPRAVWQEDRCGCTPLHAAAHEGLVDLAQALIEHGAVLDAADVQGETPLHVAARAGQVDVIKMLVDTAGGVDVDAVNEDGHTPLVVGAFADKAEACDVLLDYGATVGEHNSLRETELPQLLETLMLRRILYPRSAQLERAS